MCPNHESRHLPFSRAGSSDGHHPESTFLTLDKNIWSHFLRPWCRAFHVFREGDGKSKGAALETYQNNLFVQAEAAPGDDFFSALTRSTFRCRPLIREEMLGYRSIMFAGGRDTVINSI